MVHSSRFDPELERIVESFRALDDLTLERYAAGAALDLVADPAVGEFYRSVAAYVLSERRVGLVERCLRTWFRDPRAARERLGALLLGEDLDLVATASAVAMAAPWVLGELRTQPGPDELAAFQEALPAFHSWWRDEVAPPDAVQRRRLHYAALAEVEEMLRLRDLWGRQAGSRESWADLCAERPDLWEAVFGG